MPPVNTTLADLLAAQSAKPGDDRAPPDEPAARYAKVSGGLVVNAIKASPSVASKSGFVPLPDAFTVGDAYDAATGTFTKAPALAEPAQLELTKGQITARIIQIEREIATIKTLLAGLQ